MYKCVNSFSIEKVDDNGFMLDNEHLIIPEGSEWHLPEDDGYRFVGGEVRLESDGFGWIEISKETLKGHFEEIQ